MLTDLNVSLWELEVMQYQSYSQAPALQGVGVGKRLVAVIIDGIIFGIIVFVLSFIFVPILGPNQMALITFLAYGLAILLFFIYYIVMEATKGATVGKMVMGLKVVKDDGTPISWSESIIRNLLRIIDGLFAYLVGAIIIWTNPHNKRLGDIAAHTLVVSSR